MRGRTRCKRHMFARYWIGVSTLLLALSGCQSGVEDARSHPPADFSRPHSINALVEMSDLVLVGTVSSSGDGRIVGPEGETGVAFIETLVAVEEVLAGDPNRGEVAIETEKVGAPYTTDWQSSGNHIIAFLVKKAGEQYRPVAYESILLTRDNDVQETVRGSDWSLVAEMTTMTRADLIDRLRRAAPRQNRNPD